ncbi:hypothetical protein [Streptomyces sp. 184]|uniref:hypothetical protein n=1 Tax=Streptomyces sp. 184 TaxID=1827526 RepID=UPI003892943C
MEQANDKPARSDSGGPEIGDKVYDPDTGREAIVTDRQQATGILLLRAIYGTDQWHPADPTRLTVVCPRDEMRKHI